MKITVPGFITEENVQEAMKRFTKKGVSPHATVFAAVATTIGMPQQLGGDAGIAAGTPPTPDIAALGDTDPSVLASLTQAQLEGDAEFMKFAEAEPALRGADASEFMKSASHGVKLIQLLGAFSALHPKNEITLPPAAH
jgi:hypothetical protein